MGGGDSRGSRGTPASEYESRVAPGEADLDLDAAISDAMDDDSVGDRTDGDTNSGIDAADAGGEESPVGSEHDGGGSASKVATSDDDDTARAGAGGDEQTVLLSFSSDTEGAGGEAASDGQFRRAVIGISAGSTAGTIFGGGLGGTRVTTEMGETAAVEAIEEAEATLARLHEQLAEEE